LPKKSGRGDHGAMPERRDEQLPPTVVATTLPFFARAASIVDETWHELDRMAGALDQRAEQLSSSTAWPVPWISARSS